MCFPHLVACYTIVYRRLHLHLPYVPPQVPGRRGGRGLAPGHRGRPQELRARSLRGRRAPEVAVARGLPRAAATLVTEHAAGGAADHLLVVAMDGNDTCRG